MIEKLGVRLYTVEDAAEVLGVDRSTIRVMRYDGRLPATRIGRSIYFTEETLRNYLLNGTPTPMQKREAGHEADK